MNPVKLTIDVDNFFCPFCGRKIFRNSFPVGNLCQHVFFIYEESPNDDPPWLYYVDGNITNPTTLDSEKEKLPGNSVVFSMMETPLNGVLQPSIIHIALVA